jgi:hypothetical protein
MPTVTSQTALEAMVAHGRTWGLPAFAQFDNATRRQGSHQHHTAVGRVIQRCLALEVVPVFATPRETGFQAAIAGCNAQWQAKVWARFYHGSLADLRALSTPLHRCAPLQSHGASRSGRTAAAVPPQWRQQLDGPLRGRIIHLRCTSEHGTAQLHAHRFTVNVLWPHRLVRREVDVDNGCMTFDTLSRCEPTQQPLIRVVPIVLLYSTAARSQ